MAISWFDFHRDSTTTLYYYCSYRNHLEHVYLVFPGQASKMEERPSTEMQAENPVNDRESSSSATASTSQELNPSQQHKRQNPLISRPKVAIPRQRPGIAPLVHNRRVRLACVSCRQRKTKCNGETPVCRQCEGLNLPCGYPVSWKERTRGYVYSFFVYGFG